MKLLTKHRKELEASKIHPHVIALNFESLEGQEALEALLYEEIGRVGKDQKNPHSHQYVTSPIARILKRYKHVEPGGWWCSGIDPLTEDWKGLMQWGCFKPDKPRQSPEKDKLIKYEHPPGTQTRAFFLRVSWEIGLKVAIKAKKEASYRKRMVLGMNLELEDQGFWEWVHEENVPIILEEGAKKAGATLSAGYAAIGLPGVTGAVRTKNQKGEKVQPFLIAEIELFATEGREIYICFDHDTKRKTIKNVDREIGKLAELLLQAKSECRIINLPGPEKGVDDFLVERGEEAFDELVTSAIGYRWWQHQKAWKLTYPRSLVLNSRYLGDLPYPQSGICGIKSPKGTGKTKSLAKLIKEAMDIGRKVLVITHRIELGRGICHEIGLNWVDECKDSVEGKLFGFGFCIDSCHAYSQAQFNPEDWEGAIVVLDEWEQVAWHGLNSATCYEKRPIILRTFERLIQVVLGSEGLVIAQDADLSDYSLDYLVEMSGQENLTPYIIENTHKSKGRNVWVYRDSIEAIVTEIEKQAGEGKKVLIPLDSQKVKGKYSSINLECQLKKKFPDKLILRIDSQTVSDPNHPAFACAKRINDVVGDYDIVIYTPTMGTGVSIDIKGHFDSVFGIFKGAIATNDVLQTMSRYRDESADWHIWAARYACSKIGNGASNDWVLWNAKDKVTRKNLELLDKADKENIELDLDTQVDPRHTRAWAKFGARINAGQWDYRSTIVNLLIAEGHRVNLADDSRLRIEDQILSQEGQKAYNQGDHDECDRIEAERAKIEQELEERNLKNKETKVEAAAIRTENRINRAKKIVAIPKPDRSRYEKLQEKRAKTPDEILEEEKYRICDRYATDEPDEVLVLKDEDGWHSKIRADYYMRNPEKVVERDHNHLKSAIENGEGNVTLQDIHLMTAKIQLLLMLKIPELLNGETYTQDSELVQDINSKMNQARWEIKNFTGYLPSPDKSPIRAINDMLNSTLGIKLTGKLMRIEGERVRGYSFVGYDDGREAVWERWQIREQEWAESQINERMGVTPEHNIRVISKEINSDSSVTADPIPPEIDQPTSVVVLEEVEEVEEVGTVEVMAVEEVEEEQTIAPIELPTPPQAPQEGWVIAPPDQYWEDVMVYVYQGVNPIKQWIGKFVGVVSTPFQYWVDSPWFVQGIIRDGMGNRQEVVLPIALIG